jgi:hypothetical protein
MIMGVISTTREIVATYFSSSSSDKAFVITSQK